MAITDGKVLSHEDLLAKARDSDIRAFHTLFVQFQPQLKSYLYRLLGNRNSMEDIAHDVFIAAFDNIKTFRGEATLKSWVFTIATNMARRHLKKEQRWATDTFEQVRRYAHTQPGVLDTIDQTHQFAPQGSFEIREHINYCFTCVTKMLPLKQQITLILVDVYGFKIAEVSQILDVGLGAVKHLLRNARQTMVTIFDHTCALVNKNGICNQCSALNGRFNPKQDEQAELMKIKWVKERNKYNTDELLRLRTALVQEIDPLHTRGADLHDLLLTIGHTVNQA